MDPPGAEECWLAYFARPEIDPAVYGFRCHALPIAETSYLGAEEIVPPAIQGTVLISAGDLSGCEWSSGKLNPYRNFQSLRPVEVIDNSVFVYRGTFAMADASLWRAQTAAENSSRQNKPSGSARSGTRSRRHRTQQPLRPNSSWRRSSRNSEQTRSPSSMGGGSPNCEAA